MRKAEIFFDAITGIREELIEEALDHRFVRKQIRWQRYVSIAACLALVATLGFGAIRLGIIGGMGGSDSAANNSVSSDAPTSDSAAPESPQQSNTTESPRPPADTGAAESGGSIPGEAISRFTGTVLEIHENALLVKPNPGEAILSSADRILVPLMDVENLWDIQVGEEIAVTYAGGIQETYPAMLTQVLEIVPTE